MLSTSLINIGNCMLPCYGVGADDNLIQAAIKPASDPTTFISFWHTHYLSSSSSQNKQIHLPLISEGIYDFTVDWGDESNNTIKNWNQTEVTHTYSMEGVYTILINGTIIGWRFNDEGDKLKIMNILQWGCLQLGNAGSYFSGCENLILTATDTLNLAGTTNLNQMFSFCSNLGISGNLNTWDVSMVTDMSSMFLGADTFNQPLGAWNVSTVTDMSHMFWAAHAFNQPLGAWNVSNVKNMNHMFSETSLFNQPLGTWDVSMVTDMSSMFLGADTFNQPLGAWNVSTVTDMNFMFSWATTFNQPLQNWNTSSVTDMNFMFSWATTFNQPLGTWDVSNVLDMSYMFYGAIAFNQPLETWNTSSVTDMSYMFWGATAFNQPLGAWNVSNVTDMSNMFYGAITFNQPLGTWNISSVEDMTWMFVDVTLSTINYDNLLLGWSALTLQRGVNFDAGNSKYSPNASVARQQIIDTYNWTISDGGEKHTIPGYSYRFLTRILITMVLIFVIRKKGVKIENTVYYDNTIRS